MNKIEINTELRHELKYYINYFEYERLRHRLKHFMCLDSYSVDDRGYYIRSLYFDDPDNRYMFEKQAGFANRRKIRVRTYNNSYKIIKLEKKSKFNQLVKKEAVEISREEYEKLKSNQTDFLRAANSDIALIFYAEFRKCLLQPKVIVDYMREAYLLPYEGVRITFDKMLSASSWREDLFSSENIVLRAMEPTTVIMEIKFDLFLPDYLRNLIDVAALRRSAISKYLLCRERIDANI